MLSFTGNDCGVCNLCCRPTIGSGSILGGMSGVKTPPSFSSTVFPNNTSTMPGSPHTSSLLNSNFFAPQLDFGCQGKKYI